MKKALAILMILALVGSAAFAEITFGAWGRGLFVPVMNSGASDEDSSATNKASWGGAPRIGFTISGGSDNVGFVAEIKADGAGIAANDQQFIWVKPVSMLKLSLGRVQDDTLRGNAAYGSFNWDRAYGDGSTGEDFTFSRLSTGVGSSALYDNKQGVIAAITPTDALFIGVAIRDVNGDGYPTQDLPIDANNDGEDDSADDISSSRTADLINKMQIAVGYTIADVGQVRAQIIRNVSAWDAEMKPDDNNDTVEVAFKYTGMENLYVDAGFRMWTNSDVTEKKQISLYGNYKVNAATIHASTQIDLNGDMDAPNGDMGLYVGAGVDYALDGGVGVSADIRYTNDVKAGSTDAVTTFFAGATKGFSNGLIGAGVEVKSAAETGYSVPVRFEYWF